jgi:hypothetical protein
MVRRAGAPKVTVLDSTARRPSTMGEPTLDDVKKSVNPIIDAWSKKFSPISKRLEELLAELKELEKNKAPSADDKAKKLKLTLTRGLACSIPPPCGATPIARARPTTNPPCCRPSCASR